MSFIPPAHIALVNACINDNYALVDQMVRDTGVDRIDINSSAYVMAIRIAMQKPRKNIFNLLMSCAYVNQDYSFDKKTLQVAAHCSIEVFRDIAGHNGDMLNLKVEPENHPLSIACRIGNDEVANLIIRWIRSKPLDLQKSKYFEELKYHAITMSARAGNITLLTSLVTHTDHAFHAIKTLINNFQLDSLLQIDKINEVDLSMNNFQLLHDVSSYPNIVIEFLKHPSLKNKQISSAYIDIALRVAKMQ